MAYFKSNAKKAFDLKKGNEWYGVFYADLLTELGEFEKAASVYQEIINTTGNNPDLYLEQAYLYVKANQIDKAIGVYDVLEDKLGVHEKTARQKHALYSAIGKKEEAAQELEKLIAEFPLEIEYYHVLAQFYDQVGKKAKAKNLYDKILEMAPDDPLANIARAETLKNSGDDVAYLKSIKELFKNSDINIDIKVKELYPYINKFPKVKPEVMTAVLDLAKTMTEVHSSDPKSYSIYADLLYYSGKVKESLVQYHKTLEIDNSVFSVWEQVMYIYAELNDFNEVLKISEEAIDLFPNQPTAYYLNGVAYGVKKRHLDAVDVLEQGLMMTGRDQMLKYKIYGELGSRYHALKKHKESDKNFEAALKINPKDYLILNNYSYYLSVRGVELEKAQKMSAYANELAPNRPSFQDTYGWILFKLDKFNDAEKWLKKALENGGEKSPEILEHYGDVLYKLKKVDEAVLYWQKAKTNGSNSKKLDKKISGRKLYE